HDGRPRVVPAPDSTRSMVIDLLNLQKPSMLEITYELGPDVVQSPGFWETRLQPPLVRQALLLGMVRWQVHLPASIVALHAGGDGVLEQELQWHRWRWQPTATLSTEDLENWLAGKDGDSDKRAEASHAGVVLLWQSTLAPLRLVHWPTWLWLLGCTFAFL